MDHLNQGNIYRLVLIIGPENSETTARLRAWASQLARGYGTRVAWLALGSSHNQPENFLASLDQAIEAARPLTNNLRDPLTCHLDASAPEILGGKTLEDALTERINRLVDAAGNLILVLDNYEAITSTKVHQMVGMLMDYLPHKALVVIASRSEPPLPLARLRVRRQMLELSPADLEFL